MNRLPVLPRHLPAAEAAGATQLSPEGGAVAAIVRDDAHASLVRAEGRTAVVYTSEKIGRLLSSDPHRAGEDLIPLARP